MAITLPTAITDDVYKEFVKAIDTLAPFPSSPAPGLAPMSLPPRASVATPDGDRFYSRKWEADQPNLYRTKGLYFASVGWKKQKGADFQAVTDAVFAPYRFFHYLNLNLFSTNSPDDLLHLTIMMAMAGGQDSLPIVRRTVDSDGNFFPLLGSLGGYRPNTRAFHQVSEFHGNGEAVKRKIFKEEIFPKILDVYANTVDDSNFDPAMKRLVKDWWAKDKDKVYDLYLDLGLRLVDGEGELPAAQNFFKIMHKPSTSYKDNMVVLEVFGFSDYVSKNDSSFDPMYGLGRRMSTLGDLEALKKDDPTAFAVYVAAALNVPEATAEDKNDLNQCALITALIHTDASFGFRNYIEKNKYHSPLQASAGGNKRIYPVTITGSYNPNKLINNCVIHRKVKNIFNTSDTKTPHNMVKGIFWVYEDNKNALREAELSTNSTVHKKKISTIYQELNASFTLENEDQNILASDRFRGLDRIKDSSYYFLENTKINFDGTDPSTARNDVKVEMTWKLGSLEGLNSTLAILGTADGLDMETVIDIKDLITLPLTKKPDASDGPGSFITNQYSPNYSRLRLKVAPYGDNKGDHQNDCMILDLAIIDHQINRSSETGETTLTINYRGYFEATLNMPFNDALADSKTIESRTERQSAALNTLVDNDCDIKTVRKALRLEQQTFEKESTSASAGTILRRMSLGGWIHSYKLDETKMAAGTYGNLLDGEQMYVEKVGATVGLGIGNKEVKALAVDLKESKESKESAREETLEKLDNKFFFLGDLMWALLDCLYERKKDTHRPALKNLNLKFIMGTIYVPNPKDLGGPPITINPVSIPVDLRFFVQWFDATVVGKGLAFYPVGTFIRDLIERMINGIIYETCFSLLLPDENPPLLRSRTFVSSEKDWFTKDGKGWFNPNSPFGGNPTDILFPKSFVSTKTNPNSVSWSQEIISTNYCVIYQQFPSYKRQLAAENNRTLKEDEYTPTIYYGAKNKNYNFLSDVSFAKTNSPYLREARYFNTNYGGLSLLSNVYDLDFSFKRRKANTMFYPGCIINFVLLDWGQRWVDEPPWKDNVGGNIAHYFDSGELGDSNPHKGGDTPTMSNIMGMGGYFIIKSVEYNLGQTPGEFEINISTKFLGNDAAKPLTRTDNGAKVISDKQVCVDAFNVIAERFNDLIYASDGNEEPATLASLSQTGQAASREPECLETPGALIPSTGYGPGSNNGERETSFTTVEGSTEATGNKLTEAIDRAKTDEQKAIEENNAWLEGLKK